MSLFNGKELVLRPTYPEDERKEKKIKTVSAYHSNGNITPVEFDDSFVNR